MRALWSDRPKCSHNVSQKVKRIRRVSELWQRAQQKKHHYCVNGGPVKKRLKTPLSARLSLSLFACSLSFYLSIYPSIHPFIHIRLIFLLRPSLFPLYILWCPLWNLAIVDILIGEVDVVGALRVRALPIALSQLLVARLTEEMLLIVHGSHIAWLNYSPARPSVLSLSRCHFMGNVSETPTPTTCLKSTAVHPQFVRQYAPHLYRRTFLASKLRRKGNPAIHPPFVLQYPPHLYGSTPPICTAVLLEKYWGLGSPERFWF